ncbi:alpha/beta fold hydrolase [Blastococcus mobilis]|uniref:Acyl-CoA synthetase (AMP-forming)/AMP-acid ligase II n=1 Tax=Blastococcus mobilis TaxID=1938746 RepID=A0A239AA79_9ACTN|nr:alpha/beta fold hydrolase [Blastococcus mobilis]SNR92312.1 Acyl-CoA synthetase (AMP-forming)/AMP-acid ligase II [Blastococcus mobilis]
MTAGGPVELPGLEPAWSRWITVPDADGEKHRWHVLDNGVADPAGTLLCVHGNPTWSYLWRRMVAAAPPGWRVVAPDQLGMGWSDRPGAPRTLAQRVADLRHLTAALGVTGPVVTVAHDWGGIISLGWALEHRRDVRGVVLTNTAVAMPEGDLGPALIRLAHAPGVRTAVTVSSSVFVRGATALSWPPLPREIRRAYAQPYPSPARRRAVGEFVADIPFRPGHPSRPAQEAIAEGIRTLDVPALLLWGPRDPVFGEKYLADLRQRLPQAAVHRYEGASHLLPEDAPGYAEAVATWVTDTFAAPDHADAGSRGTSAEPARPWAALAARSDDDSPAVVETGGGSVTWARLARRVADLASGLAAAGVGPGDRVALLLEPSADLTAAVYATWRAGAVIVVADKGLGLRGMRRALRGATPDHVLGSTAGLAAARAMGLPGTRTVVGPASARLRRVLGAEHDLASLEALGRSSAAPTEAPPDSDCAVVFTSGATGPAKGVVYTQRQVGAQLELVRAAYRLTPDDSLVAAFAPFSVLGPGLGIASSVPDIDVTAPGTLTAAKLADAAAAVDATVVFAAPAALRRVAATTAGLTGEQRSALRRIRLLMSAGAPVPTPLLRILRETFPRAEAHTPYGMTEALPVTDVSLDDIEVAGPGNGVCVGRPVPGVEVRVSPLSSSGAADGPLTGSADVLGEVCVRGPHVKDRYDVLWATERADSRDRGWHRTGDVGHLDGEGRLWIEGRLAHVISTADGPVTPVGPEQRIERLDAVSAAAVVGVGPEGAQVVVAVVVPRAGDGQRRRRLRVGAGATRLTVAPVELADRIRAAAGTRLAAVLETTALPVDIRHQSKVDRAALARRATRTLSGTPVRWATRNGGTP